MSARRDTSTDPLLDWLHATLDARNTARLNAQRREVDYLRALQSPSNRPYRRTRKIIRALRLWTDSQHKLPWHESRVRAACERYETTMKGK